jgi:hypothetical protein
MNAYPTPTTKSGLDDDARYFARLHDEAVMTVRSYERFAAEYDAKGETTRARIARDLAAGARKALEIARADRNAAFARRASFAA